MTDKDLIITSGSILVNQQIESVFSFFANPKNDSLWRTEINKSILNGSLQAGVLVSEYSFLSKKVSNNLLELKCIEFENNKMAVFETEKNSKFYLKSERRVNAISTEITEVFYKLSFDKSIVKFVVGFGLPSFIISMKANNDLKNYLEKLKSQLEKV